MTAADLTCTAVYTIRASDNDTRGIDTLSTVCNLLQDAAGRHAHAFGLDIDDMLDLRHTWVLSRLTVRLDRLPRWRDRVTVRTWPSGANRLFAFRDFELAGPDGNCIGRAASAWVVIEASSRRPVNPGPFLANIPRPLPEGVGFEPPGKLPSPEPADSTRSFTVRHGELDLNGHVNNVSYVAWATETLPDDILRNGTPAALDIVYLGEAVYGDDVDALIARDSAAGVPESGGTPAESFLHAIRDHGTGRDLARARTAWRTG